METKWSGMSTRRRDFWVYRLQFVALRKIFRDVIFFTQSKAGRCTIHFLEGRAMTNLQLFHLVSITLRGRIPVCWRTLDHATCCHLEHGSLQNRNVALPSHEGEPVIFCVAKLLLGDSRIWICSIDSVDVDHRFWICSRIWICSMDYVYVDHRFWSCNRRLQTVCQVNLIQKGDRVTLTENGDSRIWICSIDDVDVDHRFWFCSQIWICSMDYVDGDHRFWSCNMRL